MKLLVINGPNLNFLGIRKKEVYGEKTYEDLVAMIDVYCQSKGIDVDIFQSNHEGAIIDKLQSSYEKIDGLIINAGAFTHYSYAIRDAIESINTKVVEVHISNIYEREEFRRISVIKDVSDIQIVGKGLDGYIEAIKFFIV